MLTASRLLVAVSPRSIAAVDESISLPQFRLLVVLATRGQQKVTDLAEALGVNPLLGHPCRGPAARRRLGRPAAEPALPA